MKTEQFPDMIDRWRKEASTKAAHEAAEKMIDVVKKQIAQPKGKPETANGLTRNIIRVINLTQGAVAYRVNNTGIWDAAKGIHRTANTEKGLPDIWACYKGRFVTIEVKSGKDRLSEDQKKRAFEIERAGGIFFEARSTDDFLRFWSNLKNEMGL